MQLYGAVPEKSALATPTAGKDWIDTRSDKFWIFLLCGALIVSAAAAILLRGGAADEARVYLDGVLIETLDISPSAGSYSITVDSEYGVNVITVDNGRVCISDADCPDGSCIRLGWVGGGMTPIVCLPHKLVIEMHSAKMPDVDAVAR